MILGQFAARNLNLTKLESRPTKKALGEYCFVIDIEGHVADEVVADCLRDLHATLPELKFLGSYPAAGEDGERLRQAASEAWRAADNWVQDLRKHHRPIDCQARTASGPSEVQRYDQLRSPWRDGRAAECEALEKPWECKLPVGSNPTPSAYWLFRGTVGARWRGCSGADGAVGP